MRLLISLSYCLLSFGSTAQQAPGKKPGLKDTVQAMIVEAACGQCQFGLQGETCDLAVRFKGKAYFIDGTHIDSHGDAHADDGFCKAIRKAEVQGKLVNNRFKATRFKLLAVPPGKIAAEN